MFIHHVFFTLKNKNSAADKAALIEGLESMRTIPRVRMLHVGVPAPTDRDVIDRSYSVSWLLVFDNLEDEEVYQHHPIHKAFVERCKHLWEKVVVYDAENAF
jgi:Stress responsive A/B Barrel Domain